MANTGFLDRLRVVLAFGPRRPLPSYGAREELLELVMREVAEESGRARPVKHPHRPQQSPHDEIEALAARLLELDDDTVAHMADAARQNPDFAISHLLRRDYSVADIRNLTALHEALVANGFGSGFYRNVLVRLRHLDAPLMRNGLLNYTFTHYGQEPRDPAQAAYTAALVRILKVFIPRTEGAVMLSADLRELLRQDPSAVERIIAVAHSRGLDLHDIDAGLLKIIDGSASAPLSDGAL